MTRRTWAVLAASAALWAHVPAQAQGPDARLSARLNARTRSAVSAIVDSARGLELPTEPLVQRALEGAAKRNSSLRIINAVRDLLGDLNAAREALGPSSSAAELQAGASAIREGIPARQLQRIREARSGVRLAVALSALTDLVSTQRVPVDTAASVIWGLVRAPATDEEIDAVVNVVRIDVSKGIPPGTAAWARGEAQMVASAATPANGRVAGDALPSARGPSPTNAGPPTVPQVNANKVGGAPAEQPRPIPPPRGNPKHRP